MQDLVTKLSIFAALIPIALSVLTIRTFPLGRYLLLILTLGFCTELYLLLFHDRWMPLQTILIIYSFFESFLYLWLVKARTYAFKPMAMVRIALFFSTPLLLLALVLPTLSSHQLLSGPGIFNLIYEIVVAFVAGRELLRMTESIVPLTQSPHFWITLAVFLYCFCTFFLVSMLTEQIAPKFWYLHNIINIAVLALFSIGLIKAFRRQNRSNDREEQDTRIYTRTTQS